MQQSTSQAAEQRHLRRRYARDKRFRVYTILAIMVAGLFLCIFIADLVSRGLPALRQAEVLVPITYNEETVEVPNLAIPEAYREIVSRTRLRQIPREGERNVVRLTVEVDAEARADAKRAIVDMELTPDEFFGKWREEAPYLIEGSVLARFVAEPGLEQIAAAIDGAPDGPLEVWVWVGDDVNRYLNYGGKIAPVTLRAIEVLENAGRLERQFDSITWGEEGTTVDEWVLANSKVDQFLKGKAYMQPERYEDTPEFAPLSPEQIAQIEALKDEGRLRLAFNSYFFLNGDSKIPEAAGLRSAIIGSVYVLTIVFLLCMPVGVMTAIYLEEFAPDNFITQTIEVNINNLAAIPSILFGVLGLAVLINIVGMPRSSALVGGATLALMTLPVIIISSRSALRAVPDSIRMAGHAMGATRWQVVIHHVLPLSTSGILTGSIIGIAQAMGETAPLIIVGLVAFVPEAPTSPLAATTVMPAQIFSWWEMPQRAFEERAALAILVLLVVLFTLNGLAVMIRARAERKW